MSSTTDDSAISFKLTPQFSGYGLADEGYFGVDAARDSETAVSIEETHQEPDSKNLSRGLDSAVSTGPSLLPAQRVPWGESTIRAEGQPASVAIPIPVVAAFPREANAEHQAEKIAEILRKLIALNVFRVGNYGDRLAFDHDSLFNIILPALSEIPIHVQGLPVITRKKAASALAAAILKLSTDEQKIVRSYLAFISVSLKVFPAEDTVEAATPTSKSADLPDRAVRHFQATLTGPAGLQSLALRMADNLSRFCAEMLFQEAFDKNEGFSLKLNNTIAMQGSEPNYMVSIEGYNTKKPVKIRVHAGTFYPKGTTAHPYGSQNRNPLMNFQQNIPTRVMVSQNLKRDNVPLRSIIISVSLGQNPRNIWEEDEAPSEAQNHKTLVLRLLNTDYWDANDFCTWLSQVAWTRALLKEWQPIIRKIHANLLDYKKNRVTVADYISDMKQNKGMTPRFTEVGFNASDWIILYSDFQNQENMKPPPLKLYTSDIERKIEQEVIRSQGMLKASNNKDAADVLSKVFQRIQWEGKDNVSKELQGIVIGNLGVAYQSMGNFPMARKYHEQHQELFPENVDAASYARTCANLGIVFQSIGEPSRAIEQHEKHLRISTEVTKDRQAQGRAYCNLGISYQSLGDNAKAVECHQKHLAICQETNDKAGEGRAYANLGIIYQSMGEAEKAVEYHFEHLRIALEETRDKRGEGSAYGNIGNTYRNNLDYDLAIHFHRKHVDISQPKVATFDAAAHNKGRSNLAQAHSFAGEYAESLRLYDELLMEANEKADFNSTSTVQNHIAEVYWLMGDRQKAIQFSRAAVETYETRILEDGKKIDSHVEFRRSTYEPLIAYLCQDGQTDAGLVVWEKYLRLVLLGGSVMLKEHASIPLDAREFQKIARQQNVTIVEYMVRKEDSKIYAWVIRPHRERIHFLQIPCSFIDSLPEIYHRGLMGTMLHESSTASMDPEDLYRSGLSFPVMPA